MPQELLASSEICYHPLSVPPLHQREEGKIFYKKNKKKKSSPNPSVPTNPEEEEEEIYPNNISTVTAHTSPREPT